MNDNSVFIEFAVVINQAVWTLVTVCVILAGASYRLLHPLAAVLIHAIHFHPSGQRRGRCAVSTAPALS